jgi:hypothetical protein
MLNSSTLKLHALSLSHSNTLHTMNYLYSVYYLFPQNVFNDNFDQLEPNLIIYIDNNNDILFIYFLILKFKSDFLRYSEWECDQVLEKIIFIQKSSEEMF